MTVASCLVGAVLLGMTGLSGCVRKERLWPEHGEATRAWFAAQQRATEDEMADGLDSEEAASIRAIYQGMLRGDRRGRSQDDSPVLIIREPTHERRR